MRKKRVLKGMGLCWPYSNTICASCAPYLLILAVMVCLYAWLLRFGKLLVTTTSMAVILSLYIGFLESLLAVERNCRWDRYVLTMPIARETVVREKYCLMLLAAFLPCLAGMCMDGLFYSGAHLFYLSVFTGFLWFVVKFHWANLS